jgi:hypothetical protein
MTARFTDHPTEPGVRHWRRPPWRALGTALTLLLCLALLAGAIIAAGVGVASPGALDHTGSGTIARFATGFLVFVTTMGAIAHLLWRELRGMLGTSITLRDTGVVLRLPRGRSLIHDPQAITECIPWYDVKGIETRVELYGAQGMAMMHRVHRLLRAHGEPIFLFEQRGMRSTVETESMEELAAEIAQRAGVAIHELGTVEGSGGLLGAWGATPPPWTATTVSQSRRTVLQRRVTRTASTIGAAIAGVWLVRLLVVSF